MAPKLNKRMFLMALKYVPWLIAVGYLIGNSFAVFGINTLFLTYITSISILPFILIVFSSIALGFCVYHRLPLYYAITIDTINLYDWVFGIPISSTWMIFIYCILFGIMVILSAYIKNKNNVRKRVVKENSV